MKKNIAFLIPSLTIGGAEKLTLTLCETLSNHPSLNVFLILLEDNISYDLNLDNVKLIKLSKTSTHSRISKFLYTPVYIYKLNKIIKKYNIDIVISVMERANLVNYFSYKINKNFVPILSVHNAPSISFEKRNLLKRFSIKQFYKRIDKKIKIIAVSNGIKIELKKFFKLENISVIYNPIDIKKIRSLAYEHKSLKINKEKFNIVTVGRITEQKAFDLLIKAFSKIDNKFREEMNLVIIGDGVLKESLIRLAKELGVFNNIVFVGYQNNPYKYMVDCDLFVLTSKWEGFGIAIVEAMALGLPVISSNCKYGPSEILIKDNENYGILIELDKLTEELPKIIIDFYLNKDLRKIYRQKSNERARDFDISKIINNYIRLINEVK